METDLDLTTLRRDDITVVSLGPTYSSLYESDLLNFETRLLEIAANADPPFVVVDMPETRFCGSSFLGLLVRIEMRLKSRSGRLAVSSLSKFCAAAVNTMNLGAVFMVSKSVDEAVSELSRLAD